MFDGLNLESMPMWMPFTTSGWGAEYPSGERKTKTFTAANLGGGTNNMYGSASYNNVRKELVILNYNSATAGRFDVSIWKNIDFDANDCDVTQVSSTPTHQFSVTTPNFAVNNAESQRNIKVVLTDNGDIYYSVMYPSNSFKLYRIARAIDDSSGTVAELQSQALTTSYGIEQSNEYGQSSMKTRIGNMVMTFCPYYYYGAGLRSYVIDKRNNSWAAGYQTTDTSDGYQPLKYRDDSFAYYYCGNFYASNYTGAYIRATSYPVNGSSPVTQTNVIYLPIAPSPNTTNYPGFTFVREYDLQTTLPGTGGSL
jgi:hypothetical protein